MPAKEINLLIRADFDKTLLGRFLRWALTYGRYIIICTEIIVLLAFIYRFSLDRKITDLNDEIEQKQAIIEANVGFESQFRNLQKRTNKIVDIVTEQNTPVIILKHLQSITPQGVVFSAFSYTKGLVSINAIANSNSSFSLFLINLKTSPNLNSVNVKSLTKKSTGTGEIKFEVIANAVISEPSISP